MPVYIDPVYGPKPSLELLGGSPSTLAQGSTPFLPQGRSITMTAGGGVRTVSYARIYSTQPMVGATIRRITEALCRLPLHLIETLDEAGERRKRDRLHPAARLITRPRPGKRLVHLLWDIWLSNYVHGNYAAWKKRENRGAPPSELWSLDWRLLLPIMTGQRVIAWRWMGEGIPGLRRGQVILAEDVLHIAFAGPGGGDIGVAPLQQLGVTIRSEDALQLLAESQARHGTRFGYALILDPKARADQATRDGLRAEVEQSNGGHMQAFRNIVLGGGVSDVKPLSGQTAVEAELVDQRKVNWTEIAAVIGGGAVKALVGVLEDAKYASLKELHRMLYVTTAGGPLELVTGALQGGLLDTEPAWDRDDRFYEFNLNAILRGDPKERWETYKVAVGFGGMVLNDVRRAENLEPYDDKRADEPLIAANNVKPLRDVGTDPDDDAAPPANGPPAPGGPPEDEDAAAQAAVAEAIIRLHVRRAGDRAAKRVAAGKLAAEALDRARLERELAEDLEAVGLEAPALAEAVATDLEDLLEGAKTAEDVRRTIDSYATRKASND